MLRIIVLSISMNLFLTFLPTVAQAFIVINEILADPAAGLEGDANQDGTRSSSSDEFVELFNTQSFSVDVSGWWIADAQSTRHLFTPNSFIQPRDYFVVFGGGEPVLADSSWQIASGGSLNLNNAGDTVSLFNRNGQLIQQVIYGTIANNNQSIVRLNEGEGDFVLHSSAAEKLFSPGRPTQPSSEPLAAVPEPGSILMFLLGGIGLWLKRHS